MKAEFALIWNGRTLTNCFILLRRGPGKIAMGFASPVFITYLIMNVSGVPMLEQQHDEKYGDDPRYVSRGLDLH